MKHIRIAVAISACLSACDFPRPANIPGPGDDAGPGGDAGPGDDAAPTSTACCVTADECARIGAGAPRPCPLGVCVRNECTTASASCDGDEDCSGATKFCVADTCSVCRVSATCPVSSPVCDDVTHNCRACAQDSECNSGACDLTMGTCVDQAAIRYASPSGTMVDACTRSAPCSLNRAASLVDTGHQYIVLLSGIHPSGAIFDNKTAIIVGNSATLDLRSSIIQISNGSSVRLRNMNINGDQGFNILGTRNAMICDGGSELTIDGIHAVFKPGVNALNCQGTATIRNSEFLHGTIFTDGALVIDRSTFTDSSILAAATGNAIAISNSIFIAGVNGATLSVTLDSASNLNGGLILNNTIVGAHIGCHGTTFQHWESNIFYNSMGIDTGTQCEYNFNLITPSIDVGGMGNKTGDPEFVDLSNNDYHLKLGSPAIDAANPNRAPPFGHDRDGRPRPQGTATDIGAFEYAPSASSLSPIR